MCFYDVIVALMNIHEIKCQISKQAISETSDDKGPVTGYGKLTWEFAHAWNFMKLYALIVLVMSAIIMVYSLVNVIPLANYDVIYDVTTMAEGTPL